MSFKSEWMPSIGYASLVAAKQSVINYVVGYYYNVRPHTHNDGLSPNKSGENTGLNLKPWPKLLDRFKQLKT